MPMFILPLFPPADTAYPGKEIFVFGELTNYLPGEHSRMDFNEEKGIYEKTLFLKQGYYNYSYVTLDQGKNAGNRFSFIIQKEILPIQKTITRFLFITVPSVPGRMN